MEADPDRKTGRWNSLAKYQQSSKGKTTPTNKHDLAGTRFFAWLITSQSKIIF